MKFRMYESYVTNVTAVRNYFDCRGMRYVEI